MRTIWIGLNLCLWVMITAVPNDPQIFLKINSINTSTIFSFICWSEIWLGLNSKKKKNQEGVRGSWSFSQFNLRWSRALPCLFLEGLKKTEGKKNKTSCFVCQVKVNRHLWLKQGYNHRRDSKNEEKWQSLRGEKGPLSFFWLFRQSALGLICARSPTLHTRRETACNPWRQATVPRQPNEGGKSQISPLKAVLNLRRSIGLPGSL